MARGFSRRGFVEGFVVSLWNVKNVGTLFAGIASSLFNLGCHHARRIFGRVQTYVIETELGPIVIQSSSKLKSPDRLSQTFTFADSRVELPAAALLQLDRNQSPSAANQ